MIHLINSIFFFTSPIIKYFGLPHLQRLDFQIPHLRVYEYYIVSPNEAREINVIRGLSCLIILIPRGVVISNFLILVF
jgi:hypothetical protein